MAVLNTTRKSRPRPHTHEGAVTARISTEQQLRRTVMSCLLWENTFYENGQSIADRIAEYVKELPLRTCAEIAVEAREVNHLRHVPLLIVREMARKGGHSEAHIIGDTLGRVIQRPDELTEFLALYWKDGRIPLSAQIKKGLAKAFGKFDEYSLAKYNRTGKSVTLRDVLFLVHPSPATASQQELWDKLVAGTLETPDTWETTLSAGEGKKSSEDKQAHWTRMLTEQRLGGLALLRNLRNMLEAKVSKVTIRKELETNPFKRVLPFRFIAAARYAPDFEPELEQGMFRACKTLDTLPGKTAVLIDVSGSMQTSISANSEISRLEAAAAVGMMIRELSDDIDVFAFGTTATLLRPRRGFALLDAVRKASVGHGTDAEAGHKLAKERGYDRVIVITDGQTTRPLSTPLTSKAYTINVASYENGVGYGPWTSIDGWSEGVIRFISAVEDLTDQ